MKLWSWMIASAVLLSGNAFAAGAEAGEWEFSVKTEVEGMPPSQHPLLLKKCVAAKDVANLLKLLPLVPGATPEGCSAGEPKQQGGKTAYSYNCAGMPAVAAAGEASIGASAISGVTHAKLDSVTYKKQLEQHYSGKRVGKCE